MSITDKLINILEKRQAKNSDSISSPTNALARKIADKWQIDISAIKVIPNGIKIEDIEKYNNNFNSVKSDYILFLGQPRQTRTWLISPHRAYPSISSEKLHQRHRQRP
jgi:hypothetical protein